ncbi:hypothetical protein F5Y19DRAFT_487748 [Xylariaceae sp. FL1651]|nr:hypothetical protein F5Y19DRAFT_487748 [Xylariaceae sp. FL1651]
MSLLYPPRCPQSSTGGEEVGVREKPDTPEWLEKDPHPTLFEGSSETNIIPSRNAGSPLELESPPSMGYIYNEEHMTGGFLSATLYIISQTSSTPSPTATTATKISQGTRIDIAIGVIFGVLWIEYIITAAILFWRKFKRRQALVPQSYELSHTGNLPAHTQNTQPQGENAPQLHAIQPNFENQQTLASVHKRPENIAVRSAELNVEQGHQSAAETSLDNMTLRAQLH